MTYKIGDKVEAIDDTSMPSDLPQWLEKNNAHAEFIWENDKHFFHILSNEEPYYKQQRIWELKNLLSESDYKAIKFSEGELTEEEYAPIREQRRQWRTQINELEESISSDNDITE